MDGHFVPNITIGPLVVEAARRATKIPLDVHLMIQHPERFVNNCVDAGSDLITIHAETCPHLNRVVSHIKELGKKVGVSLNPSTSLSALDYVLEEIDLILLMTVNPGFGNQKFIASCLSKITELREKIERRNLNCDLEVDGGVKVDNIAQIANAGANVFVAGSAVFGSKDYKKTIQDMKSLIRSS